MLRRDDVYSLKWQALLIVLPPIAIFIASDLAFRSFGASGIHLSAESPLAIVGNDGAARLYILTALSAFLAMAVGAILLFGNDFARTYGPRMRLQLSVGMGAGILIASICETLARPIDPLYKYLGAPFVDLAQSWFRASGCGQASTLHPGCYFMRLEGLIHFSYATMPFLIAILIAGTGSCLATPDAALEEDARRVALDRQQRRFQGYVICAAGLLATGLLLELSWTRWPLSVLPPSELTGYQAYGDALAMFFGVIYSLMIASYAIPVAVVLQMRRAALSPAPDEAGARPGLFDNGLVDALGNILTLLLPAIIGALPVLLDLFKH